MAAADQISRPFISLASTTIDLQRRAAEQQGGLLDGKDPTQFSSTDPIRLWIIQIGIIIMVAQLLAVLLKRIREPKVIAEVLGGILLGPTALGRIPGFTEHIFPQDSIPFLSLTANIGLVLFLFLVGLEIETNVIKRNARHSVPIALAGMVLPFGLGAALSLPIYRRYIDPEQTSYQHFMLFTGVSFSITAFPVLCRILTELKLVDTTVGIVVLSAGVGNDIVGWTLLALAVALVNASSGLSALWILLTAVAWTLFLLIPVKRVFKWLARRTGSIENGPTMTFMTATILMTFASAFITDTIGVHAIFGGFLAGLVVPREGGLAIALTEKLEDVVSIIFLPLYFTLSGLSTDLGLLNNGITWGFTVSICCLAYFGKFGGCSVAARLSGFRWREACTIGSLMSCKGLVELIVLNVGLSAGILTQRVFSMFVFEALLLTCLTTPVVLTIYPPSKRTRATDTGPDYKATMEENGKPVIKKSLSSVTEERGDEISKIKTRFTVVLDKIEHLPGMMAFTQLISSPPPIYESQAGSSGGINLHPDRHVRRSSVSVDALRLIELSDRTSAVMKSTSAASGGDHALIPIDPLLNVFRTFGELNGLEMSSSLSVVMFSDLAARVADRARDMESQLVLVPWLSPSISHSLSYASNGNNAGGDTQAPVPPTPTATTPLLNPFDLLFRTQSYAGDRTGNKAASMVHSQFVRAVFAQCRTDVALYVDRIHSGISNHAPSDEGQGQIRGGQHIFLPFFGGPDDRLALDFVVQLCANPSNSATVIRITKSESEVDSTSDLGDGGSGSGVLGEDEDQGGIREPKKAHVKSQDDGAETESIEAAAANIRANGISIHSTYGMPDTIYGAFTTQTRLQSETADNLAWARYTSPSDGSPLASFITESLSRIDFRTHTTPRPLHFILNEVASLCHNGRRGRGGRRLIVVLGRSRRLAAEDHSFELKTLSEECHGNGGVGGEVRKTVGDVASAIIGYAGAGTNVNGGVGEEKRIDVGIVVMQATHRKLEDE